MAVRINTPAGVFVFSTLANALEGNPPVDVIPIGEDAHSVGAWSFESNTYVLCGPPYPSVLPTDVEWASWLQTWAPWPNYPTTPATPQWPNNPNATFNITPNTPSSSLNNVSSFEQEYDAYDEDLPPGDDEVPIPPDEVLLKRPDDSTEMDISKTTLQNVFKYKEVKEAPVTQVFSEYTKTLQQIGLRVAMSCSPSDKLPTVDVVIERSPKTLVGIEIELENFVGTNSSSSSLAAKLSGLLSQVWRTEQDGSLRNGGVEWLTRPIPGEDTAKALLMLQNHLSIFYKTTAPSYRCGTHIHVDVRDFTVAQLINLCILYVLFENYFYAKSGNRWRNIYCVPVRASPGQSGLEYLFKLLQIKNPTYRELRAAMKKFKKYLAFNLCPIGNYSKDHGHPNGKGLGTIEFRHHEGCSDPQKLTEWVRLILCLHHSASSFTSQEIKDIVFGMNNRANYLEFANKVFGYLSLTKEFTKQDLVNDMYQGSLAVKEIYLCAQEIE